MNDKYQEYLMSPIWGRKKKRLVRNRKFTCERCERRLPSFKSFHIHHLSYDNLFHESRKKSKDLLVLCQNCHKEIHGINLDEEWRAIVGEGLRLATL